MSRSLLHSDYVSGSNYGMKNRIINGGMDIWQRGTSFSSGINAVTYTADRWIAYAGGGALTIFRSGGDGDFPYCMAAAGAAGNTSLTFSQRIESVNTYSAVGKSFTIKARIYSSTGISGSYLIVTAPNTADTWSAGVTVIVASPSVTLAAGVWTDISFTFTTTTATQRGMEIILNWGNAVLSGNTVAMTGVQLEVGAIATPFEHRPYGTELALCQRYFEVLLSLSVNRYVTAGNIFSATRTICRVPYVVEKRAVPTVTNNSISMTINYSGVAQVSTTISNLYPFPTSCGFDFLTTGLTPGTCCHLDVNSGSISVSAEL